MQRILITNNIVVLKTSNNKHQIYNIRDKQAEDTEIMNTL